MAIITILAVKIIIIEIIIRSFSDIKSVIRDLKNRWIYKSKLINKAICTIKISYSGLKTIVINSFLSISLMYLIVKRVFLIV